MLCVCFFCTRVWRIRGNGFEQPTKSVMYAFCECFGGKSWFSCLYVLCGYICLHIIVDTGFLTKHVSTKYNAVMVPINIVGELVVLSV